MHGFIHTGRGCEFCVRNGRAQASARKLDPQPDPTGDQCTSAADDLLSLSIQRLRAAPTKSTPGLFALKEVLGMRANSFLGSERFWEQSYGCLCL